MTVRHLFLWSVKDKARGKEVLDQLATLSDVVPGIRNWAIGVNTFTSPAGPPPHHYDYALTCDFDTAEHLRAYQDHPAHQAVVDRVLPLYGDWAVVDVELAD